GYDSILHCPSHIWLKKAPDGTDPTTSWDSKGYFSTRSFYGYEYSMNDFLWCKNAQHTNAQYTGWSSWPDDAKPTLSKIPDQSSIGYIFDATSDGFMYATPGIR